MHILKPSSGGRVLLAAALIIAASIEVSAQVAADPVQALRTELREMRAVVDEMRAETAALRSELQALRRQFNDPGPRADVQPVLERLEEEQQLLEAKVNEQHQTKVESASKYRVRLSGMALFNLLNTKGSVDNLDAPQFAVGRSALQTGGSFAASVRQSLLGLEVFGPQIGAMRVGGDMQLDFGGGFPDAPDGLTFPLPRLRTAMVRLTSPSTTIAAGQDAPFFSPASPTSIASVAVPAMSYSGNLWTWIPQLRVEHSRDIGAGSQLLFQGGILDPLTGERPYSEFYRAPQAGEQSRQPAYAARVAWTRSLSGRQLSIGSGGYYSRQSWGFDRTTDAWAGTADWIVPAHRYFEFSGEFYYGRGIGGLGGGLGRTAVSSGDMSDPSTRIKGVTSTGGWAQLKVKQSEQLEWNGAFGQDNVLARDLRRFPLEADPYYAALARNRSGFVNFVYRPRSDVLLSLEYRRMRTFKIQGGSDQANQINLSMGVLF